MIYIESLKLINMCISEGLLQERSGELIPVYRNKTETSQEGWYLTQKDLLAKELMSDTKGQEYLIEKLKEKGLNF